MQNVPSISVLICTYNRVDLLAQTLAALAQARVPEGAHVELIIVDNNSSDATSTVVHEFARTAPWPVRYIKESQQGKSFALNRGVALARGDILALTDDDVLPKEDWLSRLVETFRDPAVMFTFGKVLPRWEVMPPPELLTERAHAIWGPLALVDYGDDPVRYDSEHFRDRRLPIGANLAIRRTAIEQVGGWRTDLGRVDNSLIAGEDRELCVRLYKAGLYSGLYDPELVVRHFVPASRMTRRYFRRWFFWHGRTLARMAEAVYLDLDLDKVPFIFSVPRFIYRECLVQARQWMGRVGRTDALALLISEVTLIEYGGFFVESWLSRRRHHPLPLKANHDVAAS
jgi:glycosyltransferase involved in cell wall biosynthesis